MPDRVRRGQPPGNARPSSYQLARDSRAAAVVPRHGGCPRRAPATSCCPGSTTGPRMTRVRPLLVNAGATLGNGL
eukprot:7057435-Alexandrium_andersonii.AAC.1